MQFAAGQYLEHYAVLRKNGHVFSADPSETVSDRYHRVSIAGRASPVLIPGSVQF